MADDSNGADHTGLGKGFALTAEQQRVAGIGDAPVRKGVHPDGVEGTKFSLQEMAKAVSGDLKDPKTVALLRGWGGRALLAAGNPTNESTQAQAILDAIRKRTVYVQDPINTEMIVKPKTTLCLEDGKLCIPAADCFPQGTLLLRDDFEFVKIEDIGIGDRIWGYKGWTTVENKWFKGELEVDAVSMTNGSTMLLTGDHKAYVRRCTKHRLADNVRCSCPDENFEIVRVPVSDLNEKDELIQPDKIDFGTGEMDPDRAWIEGLFVSDGWSSNNASFEISGQDGCPKEENKRKVQELCERWDIPTTWHRKYISVKDRGWTLRMQQMGPRAKFKHALSINLQEAPAAKLLEGIMADSGKNTAGDGRTFTTTSHELMVQTRVLHRMFGKSCGHSYIVDHGGLGENPIWRLTVRGTPKPGWRVKRLQVRQIDKNVGTRMCWDIATSDHFVYLPEHDVTVSNCDDRIVAYCAVLMSLGIDCRFIAQAFGTERATHVICAFRDPAKGWVRVDPSAKDWPVGKYHPATKEWWMDPTSGSLTMGGADGFPVSLGKEPEHGDFIGVGAVPEGLPEGLGVFPFAHAFSPLSHGAAYAPVGLQEGEWPPYPVTLDEIHAMGLGEYPSAHAFSPEAGAGTNAYSPIPVGLGHELVAEVERVIGMGQAYDYPYTVGGGSTGQYPNTSILGPAGTNGMDGYVGPYGYDQNTTAGDLGQGVQDALNAGPQVPIPQPQPLDASVVTWLAVGAVAVASIVVVGPLVWEWIAERRLSRAMHHGAK
jgi:hypothetical protein